MVAWVFWIGGVLVSEFVFFELFVRGMIMLLGAVDVSGFVELKEVPIVIDEFYSDLTVPFKDVVPVGYVRGPLCFKEYSLSKEFRG